MVPLSSFTAKARPRPQPQSITPFLSPMKFGSTYSPQLANDPLLSGSTPRGKVRAKERTEQIRREKKSRMKEKCTSERKA